MSSACCYRSTCRGAPLESTLMRVLVGLSGGVDSAVAAARLTEDGHEVTAFHLAMARFSDGGNTRGCAVPGALEDAERVADLLGIELRVWDFAERFTTDVIDHFLDEYSSGRTPNPCLRCNSKIKFAAALDRGLELGFEALATGHYAALSSEDGWVRLHRAADVTKDQSYVLGVLTQHQLRHVRFPLSGMTKAAVRAEAAARGLPVADKPDSLEICFVPEDAPTYLRERLGERSGLVVDQTGAVVGSHRGAYQYTIGQRKGLRLPRPAADGRPRYVLGVDPFTNTVTVGPRDQLAVSRLRCIRPTWTMAERTRPWRGLVQVRAHGAALSATFDPRPEGLVIDLDEPAFGVAPGQGAVHYEEDLVIGSATIDRTEA